MDLFVWDFLEHCTVWKECSVRNMILQKVDYSRSVSRRIKRFTLVSMQGCLQLSIDCELFITRGLVDSWKDRLAYFKQLRLDAVFLVDTLEADLTMCRFCLSHSLRRTLPHQSLLSVNKYRDCGTSERLMTRAKRFLHCSSPTGLHYVPICSCKQSLK